MKLDVLLKFIDIFAGIGGFRHGLEKANKVSSNSQQGSRNTEGQHIARSQGRGRGKFQEFRCIWSNEWDKYARQIYKKHWGECDGRDIRTVPSEEIPDHDLLCAGFPCPTYSVAGKGAGFEDSRGAVFFEIPRILRDKRPRYFLLENVKGLLSHQKGETFQTIIGILTDLGYRVEWQVLNSKHFGVPQNRERVFIIGCLGEEPGPQVFPIEGIIQSTTTKGNVRSVSGTISTKNQSGQAQWDASTTLVATCLDANYHRGKDNHGQRTMVIHDKRQAGELRVQKEPCVTKHYGTGGGNVPMVVANTVDCDGYLRDGRRKRVDGKAVPTSIPERRIRRLTPIECERLQGFPDNWTQGVSDTQRYKMLGNAVTVNVVEAIARRLTNTAPGVK